MSIEQLQYPLFVPPEELARKPRKQWNAKEAKAYKQWLLDNCETRIGQLCKFSGLTTTGDTRSVLEEFGNFVAQNLRGVNQATEGNLPRKRLSQAPCLRC